MTRFLLILFLFLNQSAFGQVKLDTSNLYYQALKLHLERWATYKRENPNLVKIPDTYFVEKDLYTTDGLPEIIDSQKIQYLTREEIFVKTKNDQGISLIAIRPAMWRNGKFQINVNDYTVTTKDNQIYYSFGGSSMFIIIFDEIYKHFALKNINKKSNSPD